MAGTYTTISGDTWDKIAKEVYGDERYTSFLMEHNVSLLSHFVFPADIEVTIDDPPEDEDNDDLPEWRDD